MVIALPEAERRHIRSSDMIGTDADLLRDTWERITNKKFLINPSLPSCGRYSENLQVFTNEDILAIAMENVTELP